MKSKKSAKKGDYIPEDKLANIRICIQAQIPLIYLVSWEEDRLLQDLDVVARGERRRLYIWTITEGLINFALPDRPNQAARDPFAVLNEIIDSKDKALYVLLDYHSYLGQDSRIIRRLRDAATKLRKKSEKKTIILLSPILKIPPELEKDVKVFDFDLPGEEILREVLDDLKTQYGDSIQLKTGEEETLLNIARGLTVREMEDVLVEEIKRSRKITRSTIDRILEEKKQIIRKSGILEYYSPETDLTDVGGLETLKNWLQKRGKAFSKEARNFGLPAPRGILLVGVQGCGKSLVAKSVANVWRLPLLRLDVGRVFTGIVGSSEGNMRKAINLAETLSPCLLWIDEIEKGFSGISSSNFSDAGTAARVYGHFITWMQEKKAPVFIIATANMVDMLPPELLRKGRFDEIFFVDLPNQYEREEIFRIHLKLRHRILKESEISHLASSSEQFSGAEIEQAIISALYDAFEENSRKLTAQDIERTLIKSVPLAQMMAEQVAELRSWARQRTRSASSTDDKGMSYETL
ncbi:MAG: hypothetical protein B6244_01445 [Candidatus Cloacimonetes bacterium 4572_55]|nr:MAG: hypothetical protein B6244_01445 [Candidatus Cloacimonetes bacterium 4572_55]